MTKSFTTVKLLQGKEPLLRQMICDVRFHDGYLYLDHCGRLLKKLLRDRSEWTVASEPVPKGAAIFNLVTGTQLRFSYHGAVLSLDRSTTEEVVEAADVEDFVQQVGDVLELVLDELEIAELARVGYREQYSFSFDSKEQTEQWMSELGLFSMSPGLLQAFAATQEALSFALVAQGQDCCYRIALNGIERSAAVPVGDLTVNIQASAVSKQHQKVLREALKKKRQGQINTTFAVVLDMDAFLLEPGECDLAEFVQARTRTNLSLFRDAVAKEPKKGKAK